MSFVCGLQKSKCLPTDFDSLRNRVGNGLLSPALSSRGGEGEVPRTKPGDHIAGALQSALVSARTVRVAILTLVAGWLLVPHAEANPVGPTVTQGKANFSSQGSHFTIQTSDRAFINWQSFNIGLGQTTTFVQPSSSSLVWNRINDPNPSQILGNLNANGYVVLQNQNGFFIGGQASITAHGFLMTTAPIPMPELANGGAWAFNAPPPTAEIVNYGQINAERGGSVFLIAHNIENHGSITVPGGDIGLYAGKKVLVSERPDGRGLSAEVTLPEGSVDNTGKLIADAGTIALRARVVNQGGLLQANSVREVNGRIELVASDAINLGANSMITAKGDSTQVSAGGSVLISSSGSFSDQASSTIDVSGGAKGGNGGDIEISAPRMSGFHTSINGRAQEGFTSGKFLLDPVAIILASFGSEAPSSGTVNEGDPPAGGILTLDVNSFNSLISQNLLSQITLEAASLIEVQTLWRLPNSSDPNALLTLRSGNNIIFDDGAGIAAGRNWGLNFSAGLHLAPGARPKSGNDGIYLNGNSFIQTQNGNINLLAPNEVIVDTGAIRTRAGGNINVATQFGNVNSGMNFNGYIFAQNDAPYYRVNAANLGGISTAAGGNVTITAGGDVISYAPLQNNYNDAQFDGGTGAFGPQPGDVSITAGGNVFGHYVLANGAGTISAGGDIGVPLNGTQGKGFALSLVKGGWSVFAPHGNIYVQDVRNPNGIFNDRNIVGYPGYHYFDYDPLSKVLLQAGNSVEITGSGMPHTAPSKPGTPIPLLLPPTLQVVTGPGGVVLDTSVTLFPSPKGDLTIATSGGGDFVGVPDFTGIHPILAMSDSGRRNWTGPESFNTADHGSTATELQNPNPVTVAVSGNLKNVDIYATKATQITVGGDVINSGFVGENLHASDVSSITVGGRIYNTPAYTFVYLEQGIASANPIQPNAWDSVFSLAVDSSVKNIDASTVGNLKEYIAQHKVFLDRPDFVYDGSIRRLGFRGPMPQGIVSALGGSLTVLVLDNQGNPIVDTTGHILTRQYAFAPATAIATLYSESQSVPKEPPVGYQIGGPGKFNIRAASLDLGNTLGILSWGIGGPQGDNQRYSALAGKIQSGAAIDVEVTGDLSMLTSTIASMYGGDVTVNSTGGELNLGSQDLFGTSRFAFGIYTSGHSDVHVTALKDINIEGSRIAAYNGGNIWVKSLEGDVNAGSGGNVYVNVQLVSRDPATGRVVTKEDPIYGSGIVATSLPRQFQTSGGNPLPGSITVETPRGDIISSKAGVLQLALDGNVAGGPTVTLIAGTKPSGGSPGHEGNIDLGDSGVIGGTVNLTAQGDIKGLVVSRQSSTINAAQNFSGTLLSAGTANVSAGGTVSGTIVGVGGVAASGAKVDAALLSQNVSVGGGQSQSTLGNSATATATSQSAAAQASSDTKEKIAGDAAQSDDENKKKMKAPSLVRKVGRVTVILPPGT
jgi:filamentous hemagglutinin family protein